LDDEIKKLLENEKFLEKDDETEVYIEDNNKETEKLRTLLLKKKNQKEKEEEKEEDLDGEIDEENLDEEDFEDNEIDGEDIDEEEDIDGEEEIDGEDFDGEDIDEEDEEEEKVERRKKGKEIDLEVEGEEQDEKDENKIEITKGMCNKWINNIKKEDDYESLKKIIISFYSAVHSLDTKSNKPSTPYLITNNSIYLRVVMGALKYVVIFFNRVLERDSKMIIIPNKKSGKYKKINNLCSTFVKSIIYLLEMNENEEEISYALQYILDAIPYFGNFQKESRKLLKCMLNFIGKSNEGIKKFLIKKLKIGK
jgi:hypothetical protein